MESSLTQQRETWIDQARWVAIVLVVVGHAVGMIRSGSNLSADISNFLYIFHIPVLVILAGWGARNVQADGEGLIKIFRQLIAPFIVFQLVAFWFNYVFEDNDPSWTFTEQTFGLWFLVALAAWRLIVPWFRGIPYAVALAVLLTLLAGLAHDIGGFLSLSRVLHFLPVFLLGPWLVDKISVWRRDPRWRAGGLAVLVSSFVLTTAIGESFWRLPFLGNLSYEAWEVSSGAGMLWRLFTIASGAIVATAAMLALPGQPGAPTKIGKLVATAGQRTMYPYLLHLPVLTVVGVSPLVNIGGGLVGSLLFVSASVVFCIITTWKPVVTTTRFLVEPLWFWNPRLRNGRSSNAVEQKIP